MAIQIFSWLANVVHKYIEIANKTEPRNTVLPGTIFKVQIRNICQIVPTQDQGSQLLSKSIDNIDYIIVINLAHTTQVQFLQELATVHNKADISPP